MRPILFVLAVVFGLFAALPVQPAEAVVLFPRLALQRQPVVVQRQAVVVQPFVLRQRAVVQQLVAPVQRLGVPQAIVAPQVLQFRSFQSIQAIQSPGCGALLVH